MQDRLYTQFGTQNPTLLYGLQTLRSPIQSPVLMELHSWLHAPEGAAQHVLGLLGFATDEINQTQQALWNALCQPMHLVSPGHLSPDLPVVLVASGPSLNDQIPWLRQHQDAFNIVSAGSALGSLLRAGIKPHAAVFLERGAQVYSDLCDLLIEGYALQDLTAILSSTIDPRVPALFCDSVFFHRPVAAATDLFPGDNQAILPVAGPHVVNAALEALLCLGTRQLLLVGADFAARNRNAPRADGALGVSPRDFNIPVRGSSGRTVFSEPGLLHTGYLLNRVISSTPGCQVFRLGEGAVLDATTSVEATDKIAQTFGTMPNALTESLRSLPLSSFEPDSCDLFFNSIQTELDLWASGLIDAVYRENGWSRKLSGVIAPSLLRLNNNATPPKCFLSRLLCQPLFYAALALYDSPENALETWQVSQNDFKASIILMKDLVSKWLLTMKPWLAASQLPLWDPDGMRRRYRRLVDTQV